MESVKSKGRRGRVVMGTGWESEGPEFEPERLQTIFETGLAKK